jgi:hypothetical protein
MGRSTIDHGAPKQRKRTSQRPDDRVLGRLPDASGTGRGLDAATFGSQRVSESRRSLAMTYHPDRFSMADQLLRDVLDRRMQEVNAAYKQTED